MENACVLFYDSYCIYCAFTFIHSIDLGAFGAFRGREKIISVLSFFAVAPDPVSNCTVINTSSETFHLQCVPGFDGGMEQIFLVTVTERLSGAVHYNETTRRLDVYVQNLHEGTSYLVSVTPMNKKGVGNSAHVIVDTLRHPAVELTQAEGGNSNDAGLGSSSAASAADVDDAAANEDDWAVVTGTLVGSLGCLTILVVASLVIRFCVCPTTSRHSNGGANLQASSSNAAYAKSDLNNASNSPGTPAQLAISPSANDATYMSMGSVVTLGGPGSVRGVARKGILKHTGGSGCNSMEEDETAVMMIDGDLARMMQENSDIIPPPPFPGTCYLHTNATKFSPFVRVLQFHGPLPLHFKRFLPLFLSLFLTSPNLFFCRRLRGLQQPASAAVGIGLETPSQPPAAPSAAARPV